MRPPTLELHLTLGAGRESECARFLRSQMQTAQWKVLAALAAELVAIHETEAAGSRVLVVQATEAETQKILQGRL